MPWTPTLVLSGPVFAKKVPPEEYARKCCRPLPPQSQCCGAVERAFASAEAVLYFTQVRPWEVKLNFDPLGGKGRATPRPVEIETVLFFANTGLDKTNVGVHGSVTAYQAHIFDDISSGARACTTRASKCARARRATSAQHHLRDAGRHMKTTPCLYIAASVPRHRGRSTQERVLPVL